MTAHGSTDTAIEATSAARSSTSSSPSISTRSRRSLQGVRTEAIQATPTVFGEPTSPTRRAGHRSHHRPLPGMHEVYKAIGRCAGQDVTVLILGESGTGKELVARAVYQHSTRAEKPFLAINCAAIPESLLESELFGHEKGAFTGADRKRIGKFEQADGGTLFLDEIGDMSPATQAKVLRVLQDQQFERVGGNETIKTDVRVVAATNQNLDALAAAGKFRQDLFIDSTPLPSSSHPPRARRRHRPPRYPVLGLGQPQPRQERPRWTRGWRRSKAPVAGECPRTAERSSLRRRPRRW